LFEQAEECGLTGLHLDWFSHAGLLQEETVKVFQKSLKTVNQNDAELVCEIVGGLGAAFQELGDFGQAKANYE